MSYFGKDGATALADMSEQESETAARWLWSLLDERGAVRWEQDSTTGEWQIAQMVLFGRVDSARLKATKFRELSALDHAAFHLAAGVVPDEQQVAELWAKRVRVYTGKPGRSQELVLLWHPRGDRGPDEFYEQVAGVFGHLQQAYPKSATKMLGELAAVPYTTAVKWVREARERGYLPLSTRQRNRQMGAAQ